MADRAIAQAQDDDAEWLRHFGSWYSPGCSTRKHLERIATRMSVITPATTVLVEALTRIKRISQREDMPAASKVACIESIAHTALASTANPTGGCG